MPKAKTNRKFLDKTLTLFGTIATTALLLIAGLSYWAY
jgi:hypothetical protein